MFSLPGFTAILDFGDEPILNTDRKKLAGELCERGPGTVHSRFVMPADQA